MTLIFVLPKLSFLVAQAWLFLSSASLVLQYWCPLQVSLYKFIISPSQHHQPTTPSPKLFTYHNWKSLIVRVSSSM
ncbi:hypothetical protein C8J56DRAFT_910272, partial [Mycena floridula]